MRKYRSHHHLMMQFSKKVFWFFFCAIMMSACNGSNSDSSSVKTSELDLVLAAKSPYAIAKEETPVLKSPDFDGIFGGKSGSELQYDRFGEIDELAFMAAPGTVFQLQRQLRKKTRKGPETIYYRVGVPEILRDENVWVDGRFLDLQDVRPPETEKKQKSTEQVLSTLRSFQGLPYTWHGTSSVGASDLLEWYPPASNGLSARKKNDWILKGFDTPGMLFSATDEQTPLEMKALSKRGEAYSTDLSKIPVQDVRAKTEALIAGLQPLDLIFSGDRMWIVLDSREVIESHYKSAFDGEVQISPLLDTVVGLFQKSVFVTDQTADTRHPQKTFFIRRFWKPGSLNEGSKIQNDSGSKP